MNSGEEIIDVTTECPACHEVLPEGGTQCSRCGYVIPKETSRPPVDSADWIAGILSLLPGMGHLFKGELQKSALILFIGIPIALLIGKWVSWLFTVVFWIWAIFDAIQLDDQPAFRRQIFSKSETME